MKKLFIIFIFIGIIALPLMALAADTDIFNEPVKISGAANKGGDIAGSINHFYRVALGLGGIAAVAVIVIGGIMYATSGAIDKKNTGKEFITSAIWGLVLLLGAFIVLNTINPQLTKLGQPETPEYTFGTSELIEGASCSENPDLETCAPGVRPQNEEGELTCCIPQELTCPQDKLQQLNCTSPVKENISDTITVTFGGHYTTYLKAPGAPAKNHSPKEKVLKAVFYLNKDPDNPNLSGEALNNLREESMTCRPYAYMVLEEKPGESIPKEDREWEKFQFISDDRQYIGDCQ
ncbi:hypothetical protein AKJ56_00720 [candidate division MSBL1 archaeon SCGC-AAA382N08]|uniref:Uncharacterized protein n=1 Tax=candidate division MSBL1 archaeon SCGC-AAA382N08 TaxID=1698285 RepID=A0A133VQB2_9EURY|nr:hypothetical protein AKJ56_00720 [candidate division MSBL1 archaeon SCGC-AAA382N08]